jgi:hypothetical protein
MQVKGIEIQQGHIYRIKFAYGTRFQTIGINALNVGAADFEYYRSNAQGQIIGKLAPAWLEDITEIEEV